MQKHLAIGRDVKILDQKNRGGGGGGSTNPPLLVLRVKDKDDPKDRQGTVYRIRCNDCNRMYIWEER